jgi:hypothetical protein
MRRPSWSLCIASLLIVLMAVPRPAWSWGAQGHQAVAYIAWQRLDQPIKDKIYALLQKVPTRKHRNANGVTKIIPGFAEWSQDLPDGLTEDQQHMYVFMRAATWADSIKHTFLHDSDTPPANMAEAASNIGFTDPDSHGYWHFIDTVFGTSATARSKPLSVPKSCWVKKAGQDVPPSPVTSLPETPVPNAVTEISLLSTALASNEDSSLKAYDLIWLEHLVGDVHQPLHASVRYVKGIGDEGGNCVVISVPEDLRPNFASSNPKAKPPAELHAFWDDLPGVGTPMETQKAAEFAATVPVADANQAAIANPEAWAKESFDMAVKDGYANPIGPALGVPKAYGITDAYHQTADDDAKARIALAGDRLAKLLTTALQ